MTSPSPADIIFNKASLALANSQRLIASWLPPPTASSLPSKSDAELEREEQEIFTPVPETLGLGASTPKDTDAKREKLSSNDKLLKQLLGKDAAKAQSNPPASKPRTFPLGSKTPSTHQVKRKITSSDSEDEAGRSSLGKPKRKAITTENQAEPASDTAPKKANDAVQESHRVPKRNRNYLDEVLEERSLKKGKKKNKKKKTEGGGGNEAAQISI